MFYNEKEYCKIVEIASIIENKSFKKLQERMLAKSMSTGIAVLFHGAPGTGKTESVYQLAKKTGREIMTVDISNTKSKWFGDSEKIIKRIFTDYREYMQENERCPILFFNEADAVIAKRKDANSSNLAQTENAIQNILLEELEKFNGILFATTNLAKNLDAAFERRFLFKVEFTKPEPLVSSKIWQSKLPMLSDDKCLELAKLFDFSGGQIDNIVRKCNMSEIIHGEFPVYLKIYDYCGEETIKTTTRKVIGF